MDSSLTRNKNYANFTISELFRSLTGARIFFQQRALSKFTLLTKSNIFSLQGNQNSINQSMTACFTVQTSYSVTKSGRQLITIIKTPPGFGS